MQIKKKLLLASSLLIVSLPLSTFAAASLDTYNYTNEVSAVRVLSTNACSGTLGKFTLPINGATPGYSSTPALAVRLLCAGSTGNTCKAVIYASQNCAAGTEVANVSLDMTSLAVSTDGILNAHYAVTTAGSTVTIKYAN